MDPYDRPYSIDLKHCIQHWGSSLFADAFFAELEDNESSLPLEVMCISGGQPSSDQWVELEDLQIKDETNGIVTGSFVVSFTEVSPTGCREMHWKDRRTGRIDFTLTLSDGCVVFDKPVEKRTYEKDEF